MKQASILILLTCIGSLALLGCDDPVVASDKDVRKDGQVVDTDSIKGYNAQEDVTPLQKEHRDSANTGNPK